MFFCVFLFLPQAIAMVTTPKGKQHFVCFHSTNHTLFLFFKQKNVTPISILFFRFKDCEDPNPLIRALAVRTMGCIRVDKITEYLCEPLRKCLKDEDPYVRKTAAVCVAKLYDISASKLGIVT